MSGIGVKPDVAKRCRHVADCAILGWYAAVSLGEVMRRREFIGLLGGAAVAWPLAARAQQADQVRRIGVLSNIAESDFEAQSMVTALREELRKLGWMDGRNLQVDHRWAAGSPERAAIFAKELVALKPDVIVAHTTPSVIELRKQTDTIPIVFVQISDPIGAGFIANVARPGGNITGFTNYESAIVGKWVEMLKEIAPSITRVSFLFNPQTAPYVTRYYQEPLETSARSLGLQPLASPVYNAREVESAIIAMGREPGGSFIIMPDSFNIVHRNRVIELAAQHRLPVISPYRFMAEEGGLMAYGIEPVDLFRRAASYVDRLLKGTKPAELPVQAPTKFELVINLKAAKALGLTVPPTLLARADEVIE
jgi:putative ABC transport system substrate-binding protein